MRYEGRNETFEDFLSRLNDALHKEFGTPEPLENPRYLSAQIVGLPRSGTTLLYQLMANTRAVGYPSNILAFFWKNPIVGARLQRQLALKEPSLSLQSLAGRTPEPLDPHEFGYFWRIALGHSANNTSRDREPWSWDRLQATLDAIAGVFEAPVVYKNFLALSHIDDFRSNLERQRYLVLDRPLVDIAASLLVVRRQIGIDDRSDFGLTVRADSGLGKGLLERVVQQVQDLDSLLQDCNFAHDPDAFIIPYEQLCVEPRYVTAKAVEFLGGDYVDLESRIPDRLEPGNGASNMSRAERNALLEALEVK